MMVSWINSFFCYCETMCMLGRLFLKSVLNFVGFKGLNTFIRVISLGAVEPAP